MSESVGEFGIESNLPNIAPEMSENEAVEVLVKLVGEIDIRTEKGRKEYEAFCDFTELTHTRTNRTSYEIEIAHAKNDLDATNKTYDPDVVKYKDLAEIPSEHTEDYKKHVSVYADVMGNVIPSVIETMQKEARLNQNIREKRTESHQNPGDAYLETSLAIEKIVSKLVRDNRKKGEKNPYMEVNFRLSELDSAVKRKFPELQRPKVKEEVSVS